MLDIPVDSAQHPCMRLVHFAHTHAIRHFGSDGFTQPCNLIRRDTESSNIFIFLHLAEWRELLDKGIWYG